jgi:hypothetical protein
LIINNLKQRLPHATVREEHNKLIQFRVSPHISLHQIFHVLEMLRQELSTILEDYTVSQVTLDDVFINFARIQQDNEPIESQPQ